MSNLESDPGPGTLNPTQPNPKVPNQQACLKSPADPSQTQRRELPAGLKTMYLENH